MAQVLQSPAARRDLDAIWDYVARDNPQAADDLIDHIALKCDAYAHQPMMGELRSDLLPGIRQFPIGTYVAFYRAMTDGIELVRVLHGARDVDSLL